jgi:hypothetical protein
MTDTTTNGGTKPDRRRVSDRSFINAKGEEVDHIHDATGARYTLVGLGKSFDVDCSDPALVGPGKPITMAAIFGIHTKVGNVANTTMNDKDDPGTVEDAAADIQDWLDGLMQGTWRETATGTARGPKYDNAILAHVLHGQIMTAQRESGGLAPAGDAAHYEKRLGDDKGYRAKVLANPAIKTGYYAELAKRGATTTAPSVAGLV